MRHFFFSNSLNSRGFLRVLPRNFQLFDIERLYGALLKSFCFEMWSEIFDLEHVAVAFFVLTRKTGVVGSYFFAHKRKVLLAEYLLTKITFQCKATTNIRLNGKYADIFEGFQPGARLTQHHHLQHRILAC